MTLFAAIITHSIKLNSVTRDMVRCLFINFLVEAVIWRHIDVSDFPALFAYKMIVRSFIGFVSVESTPKIDFYSQTLF